MRTDRKMGRTGIHDVKLTNNQKRSDVILYFFLKLKDHFAKGRLLSMWRWAGWELARLELEMKAKSACELDDNFFAVCSPRNYTCTLFMECGSLFPKMWDLNSKTKCCSTQREGAEPERLVASIPLKRQCATYFSFTSKRHRVAHQPCQSVRSDLANLKMSRENANT